MHNFPGTGMILASPLVVNGIGYIVGGGNTDWKYDPVGDQWTRIAFFGNRTGGSTFSVGGKGYFGTGRDSLGVMHTDLWQYSP